MNNRKLTQAILSTIASSLLLCAGASYAEAANVRITPIETTIPLDNIDSVEVSVPNWFGASVGILAYYNDITLNINKTLPIIVSGDNHHNRGIYVSSSKNLLLNGNGKLKINVSSTKETSGIDLYGGNLTSEPDLEISVNLKNPTSSESAYGICSISGNAEFNGKVDIKATSQGSNYLTAGIFASDSTITFNKATAIEAKSESSVAFGIQGQYSSSISLLDDTKITAKGVTAADSLAINNIIGSEISISKTKNSTASANAVKVTIDGNIEAAANSQTTINASEGSSIMGRILDEVDYDDATKAPTSTTLALHNGAKWQNTAESKLTNLIMDNGILQQSSSEAVEITNYSGIGKLLLDAKPDAVNGLVQIDVGDINIGQASAGSVINVDLANNDKINSLDSNKAEENLNLIAKKIKLTNNNGNLTGTLHLQEGLITPAASATLNFDTVNQGYAENIYIDTSDTETMNAMRNIGAASIISWRLEDSTLSNRLGSLREAQGEQGIWVRMNRGKYEYANALHGQYNFFQLGYDKAFGSWHYGAAISHNDGKTSYVNGKGNNDSTSLSLYSTWLGSKGHYADIVLKEGRLHTDYDISAAAGFTHGKYNNWGTALSGEYGQKIDCKDFYVIPQVQVSFMRIGGKNYTTDNNIAVKQDSLYSTLGRIGIELGKDIADKGNVYLRTSLLHEFAGNADTHLSLNGIDNSYEQSIGNTWYELGLGFNYKTAGNSYLYADVAKTFGDDYRTPWQWNVGMRWNF